MTLPTQVTSALIAHTTRLPDCFTGQTCSPTPWHIPPAVRSARPRKHAPTAPPEDLILSLCPRTPGTQLGWTSWGRFQKPTPSGRKTTSWWSLTTSAKKPSSSPAAAHRATAYPSR
eukprot:1885320-Rhodomonas_salina.1